MGAKLVHEINYARCFWGVESAVGVTPGLALAIDLFVAMDVQVDLSVSGRRFDTQWAKG